MKLFGREGPAGFLMGEALAFGVTLVLSSIGAFYLGKYLDGRWGTDPWLSVILPLLAIVGSFYRFIRRILANSGE
ncbi:MAG: AtpZ/AtpI family protein [Bacillota bacterium]